MVVLARLRQASTIRGTATSPPTQRFRGRSNLGSSFSSRCTTCIPAVATSSRCLTKVGNYLAVSRGFCANLGFKSLGRVACGFASWAPVKFVCDFYASRPLALMQTRRAIDVSDEIYPGYRVCRWMWVAVTVPRTPELMALTPRQECRGSTEWLPHNVLARDG